MCFDALALPHLLKKWWAFYQKNKFIVELDSSSVREIMEIEDKAHPLNIDLLDEYELDITEEITMLERSIFEVSGQTFNPGSDVQVGRVLMSLGISTGKTTKKKGQMKVDKKSLAEIADLHPLIPMLLEYSTLKDLHSKYIRVLRDQYRRELGGVRFNYFNYNVPTGRMAAGKDKAGRNRYYAEYNVQSTIKGAPCRFRAEYDPEYPDNIAGWRFIQDESGHFEGEHPKYNIRRAFIPDPDCLFFHADFAKQELASTQRP